MRVTETELPGVLIVEPTRFGDDRGWFMETWQAGRYREHGIGPDFVQANTSHSAHGVLRGLHYQWPEPQGKLVWVSHGAVFDVAVDIRRDSPWFGHWIGVELSAANGRQLWVPEGFAHGFQVISEAATFAYLCTRPYHAEYDAAIAWNDPAIGIRWPYPPAGLSAKDAAAPRLSAVDAARLPRA